MGEARRRKLAGTYPPQDGGPWMRLSDARSVASKFTPNQLGVLLDGWLEETEEGRAFADAIGSPGDAVDACFELVDRGAAWFAARFMPDGVQFRVEFDVAALVALGEAPPDPGEPVALPGLPR